MSHYIFSEKTDFSANRVVDWLNYYGESYNKYIGSTNNPDHYTLNDKSFAFAFGGKGNTNFSSISKGDKKESIDSVWFRRPNQRIDSFITPSTYEGAYPKEKLNRTIANRFSVFYDFLGYELEERHHFGSFKTMELNKPIVLKEAQKLGLTVPKTLITNSFKDLLSFFNSCNNRIITKSLHEVMRDHRYEIADDEYVFIYQMTQLIDHLGADSPKLFAPSLFQEYIEKEYEIRTIFINGKCYSAAIFSQLNEQTMVDMRNRDANTPTRYVPYQLSDSIESKITELMHQNDLSFGAIDFIRSKSGDHYFLEINPVGQYGDVSMICNYYLDKKIAEFLINNTNK